jgi:hypothetical protein
VQPWAVESFRRRLVYFSSDYPYKYTKRRLNDSTARGYLGETRGRGSLRGRATSGSPRSAAPRSHPGDEIGVRKKNSMAYTGSPYIMARL